MATPHVAGAVAQLRSLNPSWSTDTITHTIRCMATDGVISGVNSYAATPNKMLFAGSAFDSSSNLQCIFSPAPGPPPQPPSPPPTPPGTLCTETCVWASDNDCDDGGAGTRGITAHSGAESKVLCMPKLNKDGMLRVFDDDKRIV